MGGGVASVADELGLRLAAEGHEVERIAVDVSSRRCPNSLNLANSRAVARDAVAVAGRALRQRSDLVWIHVVGLPLLPALRALAMVLALRLVRRLPVVQLHAYGLEEAVRGAGVTLRVVMRVLGRAAHQVVVLHPAAAATLASVIPPQRLSVLPNRVAPGSGTAAPAASPLRLAYVGALIERKGLRAVLTAVDQLDDVVLEIVGGPGEDGPDVARELEAAGAMLAASGRARFHGSMGPSGVRAVLQGAHLLVLPSAAEGTPMAVLEALAEGRPVIVTAVGDLAGLIARTGAGVVLPDATPASIAAAIRALQADPEQLDRLAAAARAAADGVTSDHEGLSTILRCARTASEPARHGDIAGLDWGLDRRLRYRQLDRALRPSAGAGTVLELGAGPGNLTEWGWSDPVVAVDLHEHRSLDVRADAAHLPFRADGVATSACIDVLEHVPAPVRGAVLGELARVTGEILVVGGPLGAAARRTDQRLAARLARRGLALPGWLEEHLEGGPYPTLAGMVAAVGSEPVAVHDGVSCWMHSLLVRLQSRRGGWWVSELIGRRAPWLVECLGAVGKPYRQVAVFDLAAKPAFSVVLATRNRSDQLVHAIDAVLAQDDPDLELVVVDDGSSDATPEVLARYAAMDPRVRVVRNAKGSGSCGRARNSGLRAVRGERIAFIDDDNTWRPDHLRRCRAALEQADACMSSVQRYLPDGTEHDVVRLEPGAEAALGNIDANGLAVRACAMVPFPDGQGRYHSEDVRLALELQHRGNRIVGIPDITVDYHFNTDSYCFSYDISAGVDGVEVRGMPLVRSWRAVRGRVSEAGGRRLRLLTQQLAVAGRGGSGSARRVGGAE
jgi:glycosyltransferase involved in cell wall biosynthesis